MPHIKILILAVIASGFFSSVGTFFLFSNFGTPEKPSNHQLIEEFYRTENAVHVSPHGLRKELDKGGGNYLLVDLRSAEEYEKEHIISARNIPAYKDKDTSAYDEKDRIVNAFRELSLLNPNKDIVVYCYSTPCMTGRKVGLMLAENDIYVKHLGIGWNEWRYFWTLWNHEHEWGNTYSEDYIWRGSEPGTPKKTELPSPCGEGELGC